VFWSGTDETAMSPAQNVGKPWLLSVVGNKKGDLLGRLDIYTPAHVKIDNLAIDTGAERVIIDIVKSQVLAKVKTRAVSAVVTPYGYNTVGNKHIKKDYAKYDWSGGYQSKRQQSVYDETEETAPMWNDLPVIDTPETDENGNYIYYHIETGKPHKVSIEDLQVLHKYHTDGAEYSKLTAKQIARAKYLTNNFDII
jgi:hypothetical protein